MGIPGEHLMAGLLENPRAEKKETLRVLVMVVKMVVHSAV